MSHRWVQALYSNAIRRARSVDQCDGFVVARSLQPLCGFSDEIEAGVCYANKRTGATTGAWPGAQAFTGWKGSGSSGKGGCGPYYVMQFMREQSRTTIHAPVKE